MSKTLRTTNFKYRQKEFSLDEIRIIERDFGKYDFHPFNKTRLIEILKVVDPKYLFELKTIELRQKRNSIFSNRLGSYRFGERKVILFSIHPSPFFIGKFNDYWKFYIGKFGGKIIEEEKYSQIKWERPVDRLRWYLNFVVFHEIAHHYICMNRFRRKLIYKRKVDEGRAIKLADRIFEEFMKS